MLARETLARSSLETQKLELMSEVANLKLRQTALDKENMDLRKRLTKTLDLSTAATAALAVAANAAAASNQNQQNSISKGSRKTIFVKYRLNMIIPTLFIMFDLMLLYFRKDFGSHCKSSLFAVYRETS